MFNCAANSDPKPKISWQLPNGTIVSKETANSQNLQVLVNNTLSIATVKEQDEGTYTCIAQNSVGTRKAGAKLSVLSMSSIFLSLPSFQHHFLNDFFSPYPQTVFMYPFLTSCLFFQSINPFLPNSCFLIPFYSILIVGIPNDILLFLIVFFFYLSPSFSFIHCCYLLFFIYSNPSPCLPPYFPLLYYFLSFLPFSHSSLF